MIQKREKLKLFMVYKLVLLMREKLELETLKKI